MYYNNINNSSSSSSTNGLALCVCVCVCVLHASRTAHIRNNIAPVPAGIHVIFLSVGDKSVGILERLQITRRALTTGRRSPAPSDGPRDVSRTIYESLIRKPEFGFDRTRPSVGVEYDINRFRSGSTPRTAGSDAASISGRRRYDHVTVTRGR